MTGSKSSKFHLTLHDACMLLTLYGVFRGREVNENRKLRNNMASDF
jgi:hypothetical protein